jgi:hypothetical protein
MWLNDFTSNDAFSENKIYATELYDYTADPLEKQNVVDDKAYATVANGLRKEMIEFFNSQKKK